MPGRASEAGSAAELLDDGDGGIELSTGEELHEYAAGLFLEGLE